MNKLMSYLGQIVVAMKRFFPGSKDPSFKKIFRASVLVGVFTLLVKLVSFVKDVIIASEFGVCDELDAYYVSLIIPYFNIVPQALVPAFIPIYIKKMETEGKRSAQLLLSNVAFVSGAITLLLSFFFLVFGKFIIPLIGSGFSEEKIALTVKLFHFFIPIMIFTNFSIIWGAVFNAKEKFSLVALSPIFSPLAIIVFLIAPFSMPSIWKLAIGSFIGPLLEAIILCLFLKKLEIGLFPISAGTQANLGGVIEQFFPLVGGVLLGTAIIMTDQAMSAMLGPGSVAMLNYGVKVPGMILGLCLVGLSQATLPYFSKLVALKDWHGIKLTLTALGRLIFFLGIPLVLILIMFSDSIIDLLFRRGAFTITDASSVSSIQKLYFLQIPFYAYGVLLVRLISSMGKCKFLLWVSFSNLVFNIVLNFFFMKFIGISGIALSTSVVYVISCFMLKMYVDRRMAIEMEASVGK